MHFDVVATAVYFLARADGAVLPAAGAQALRGTLQHDERRKTAFMCESSEAQSEGDAFLKALVPRRDVTASSSALMRRQEAISFAVLQLSL